MAGGAVPVWCWRSGTRFFWKAVKTVSFKKARRAKCSSIVRHDLAHKSSGVPRSSVAIAQAQGSFRSARRFCAALRASFRIPAFDRAPFGFPAGFPDCPFFHR